MCKTSTGKLNTSSWFIQYKIPLTYMGASILAKGSLGSGTVDDKQKVKVQQVKIRTNVLT